MQLPRNVPLFTKVIKFQTKTYPSLYNWNGRFERTGAVTRPLSGTGEGGGGAVQECMRQVSENRIKYIFRSIWN